MKGLKIKTIISGLEKYGVPIKDDSKRTLYDLSNFISINNIE